MSVSDHTKLSFIKGMLAVIIVIYVALFIACGVSLLPTG